MRLYGVLATLVLCIIIIMGCVYGGGTRDQAGLYRHGGVCEQTPPLLALLRADILIPRGLGPRGGGVDVDVTTDSDVIW